ncbi:hypothetical protein MMC30_007442 [Trapelia coarctata]|nr:hypothetical protein [Trapelia coarctata]
MPLYTSLPDSESAQLKPNQKVLSSPPPFLPSLFPPAPPPSSPTLSKHTNPSPQPTRKTGTTKADPILKWTVVTLSFTAIGLSVYGLIASGAVVRIPLVVNLILGILTSALLVAKKQPNAAWYKVFKTLLWTGICVYLTYTIILANTNHPGSITRRSSPLSADLAKRVIIEVPPVKGPSTSSGTTTAVKNAYEGVDRVGWSIIALAGVDGGVA